MSKIIINGPVGNNPIFGDYNTVNIVDHAPEYRLLIEAINNLRDVVGNNNEELNILSNSINIAYEKNELSKIKSILNDGRDFIVQLSANYSAIVLDRITNLMGWG